MCEPISRIDVVVTVVYCDDRLLTVYNQNWGAFTLPMTGLRSRQLGLDGGDSHRECGAAAAMRNVAECLGRTSDEPARLLIDVGGVNQSVRSGQISHYEFQIYGFGVAEQRAAPGVAAEWLTTREILDSNRSPISPTARELVSALTQAALTRKGDFPPAPASGELRDSVSSVAVISRDRNGKKGWLAQWNENWNRYFLVGGHQKENETPSECMIREINEELRLTHDADYGLSERRFLKYTTWSTSAWRLTNYLVSTFDVELTDAAVSKIKADAANRWLTADEIRSERCGDGKLVSPSTRRILDTVGEV